MSTIVDDPGAFGALSEIDSSDSACPIDTKIRNVARTKTHGCVMRSHSFFLGENVVSRNGQGPAVLRPSEGAERRSKSIEEFSESIEERSHSAAHQRDRRKGSE